MTDHYDIPSVPKMNPEVKARWLTDLRSGEFRQAQSDLRNFKGEMCCLGVLANQFNPDWVSDGGPRYVPVVNGEVLSEGGIETNELSGKLNPVFLASVGIAEPMARALMRKNDMGLTFAEIADIIEEQL